MVRTFHTTQRQTPLRGLPLRNAVLGVLAPLHTAAEPVTLPTAPACTSLAIVGLYPTDSALPSWQREDGTPSRCSSREMQAMARILDLDTAAALVEDGTLLGIGGGVAPIAFYAALIRGSTSGLRIATAPAGGFEVDLLIAAGRVAELETSGISFGEQGLAPAFERAVQTGSIRLRDTSCPVILAALQAGAAGIPFAPVPGLLGSDLLRMRTDFRVIDDPFAPGRPVVLVPAIRPDVSVLHALRAEPDGTAVVSAHGDAVMLAQASRRVLVIAEEIYAGAAATLARDERLLASIYVDALAAVPGACRPLGLRGVYAGDPATLRAYLEAARSLEGPAEFLRAFLAEGEPVAAAAR